MAVRSMSGININPFSILYSYKIYFLLQTMFHTSGRPDVSATSKAARTDVISSPSPCTAGSGRRIARKCHPPTRHR